MSYHDTCLCPDPWCPLHARCRCGAECIVTEGDPAFCPDCGHDVMPVGACGNAELNLTSAPPSTDR